MGYGLAHREKSLMRIKLPPEKHAEELARAARSPLERLGQLGKARLVVRLELRDALVRAAKRLPMRRKHQHVGRKLAIAPDRREEKAQGVAFGVDGPDADIGRDGGE